MSEPHAWPPGTGAFPEPDERSGERQGGPLGPNWSQNATGWAARPDAGRSRMECP